jgi:hypothetical protein
MSRSDSRDWSKLRDKDRDRERGLSCHNTEPITSSRGPYLRDLMKAKPKVYAQKDESLRTRQAYGRESFRGTDKLTSEPLPIKDPVQNSKFLNIKSSDDIEETRELPYNELVYSEDICCQFTFDPVHWIEFPTYWLNVGAQDSDMWHTEHLRRLISSKFGAALGKNFDITPQTMAQRIATATFDPQEDRSEIVDQHGIITVKKARQWYCQTRNVKVREVGFAVPKWEHRIGTSVDGEVDGNDGIIHIKTPSEMYEALVDHMNRIKSGWKPPPFYHVHIREAHYMQMQGAIKIMNKNWCDFIVFSTKSNLSYVERIYFNQKYWDTVLWPGIRHFLQNILDPCLASSA